MFPPKLIRQILKDNIESDRLKSPIFLTVEEIYELYNFESTMTIYDSKRNKLDSVLHIPKADFSEKMTTKRIQSLAIHDLNRIHNLENLVNVRIDNVLCSEKLGGIRFLPSETLNNCQKHIFMNLYVCAGRDILMKFENPTQ